MSKRIKICVLILILILTTSALGGRGTSYFSIDPNSDGDLSLGSVTKRWDANLAEVSAVEIDMATLGSEIISNGGFANEDDWTFGDDWYHVAGGSQWAEMDTPSGDGDLTQSITGSMVVSKTYRLVYTIATNGSPTFSVIPTASGQTLTTRTTAGTYTEDFTPTTAGILHLVGAVTGGTGYIYVDNVSIKEVISNYFSVTATNRFGLDLNVFGDFGLTGNINNSAGDLVITAAGGDVTFDDENITTTGNAASTDVSATGQIISDGGAIGAPGIVLSTTGIPNKNTGFYRIGDDNWGWSEDGAKIFDMSSYGFGNVDGLVGQPSYTFNSDFDTGVYRISADQLAITAGGQKALHITEAAGTPRVKSHFPGWLGIGADSAPALALDVIGAATIGDGTNDLAVSSAGVVTLTGTARVTNSIDLNMDDLSKGNTAPDVTILGNYIGWSYDIGDDSVFTFEMPLDWASGTNLIIYAHWYINEAYASDKEVKWQLTWSATPDDETEAVDAPTHSGTLTSTTQNIPGTAKYLTSTAVDSTGIPGASLSAGDEIGITFTRIAADNDDPTADPVVTHVHIRYTKDKLGS